MNCKNQKKARKCTPFIFIFLLFSFFIASDALAVADPEVYVVNEKTKECSVYYFPYFSLFKYKPGKNWREVDITGYYPIKKYCDSIGYNYVEVAGEKEKSFVPTAFGVTVFGSAIFFTISILTFLLLPLILTQKNQKKD